MRLLAVKYSKIQSGLVMRMELKSLMLKSKFKKEAEKVFRATKIFTDRNEPRSVYDASIHAFCSGEKRSEILVFYGVGGIGKTKLLRELFSNVDSRSGKQEVEEVVNKIYVSLDAYDYNNPVNVLMSIRRQLRIECGLFDYALLQYSVKTKHTVQDISQKIVGIDSPLMDMLNDLLSLGMGSVSVPANILRKSAEIIKDLSLKRKYKDEIASIENFNEFEIYQRLPYYLGLSILNAAEKGKKHVIFFDSYESLLLRTNNSALVEDSEEWCKELFLASENVLFVIACREKIKWYDEDSEWNEYLNQHILERLVDEDSMYFLGQVPIKEDQVKLAVIKLAQGVPLYLDMCVDIYEDAVNSGSVISEDIFDISNNRIIERYIRHLKDNEKYAVKILSVVNFFDVELAEYLLQRQKLVFSNEEIRSLFDKSVFTEIDDEQEIFKIDESVRQHLLSSIETDKRHSVILNLIDYITSGIKNQSRTAFRYFEQLFKLIIENSQIFKSCFSEMIEIMYTLIDLGYWCEIHNLVRAYLNSEDIYVRSFCVFAELFYLRRTARLDEAQQLVDKCTIDTGILGSHRYLYQFLKIHIIHLSGKYDTALEQYKLLLQKITLVKENVPAHTFYTVNIKYIDLLFLKGHFRTALKMINELASGSDKNYADKAEIFRVRGHIYRFNYRLEEAAEIYDSALNLFSQERSAAFEGKIYNNLAETYCMINPEEALKYAEKSININESIDSRIELGKTYAAASKEGLRKRLITHPNA